MIAVSKMEITTRKGNLRRYPVICEHLIDHAGDQCDLNDQLASLLENMFATASFETDDDYTKTFFNVSIFLSDISRPEGNDCRNFPFSRAITP